MEYASQIMQYALTGLTLGGIYSVVALGFVVIYSVTGIINFAHGECVMLGAMVSVSCLGAGFPLSLSIFTAVVAVAVFGIIFEKLTVAPAKKASAVTLIIITIGAAIAIRGAALLVWGASPYPMPAFTSEQPLYVAGATVLPQSIWVMATSTAIFGGLYLLFNKSRTGKALRAAAMDRVAALLMGISPQRMSSLAFGLSAATAALAGAVVAPITTATYDMGLMLGLKGFIAASMGGLTSVTWAILGGFFLGLLESFGAGLISSNYKEAFAFILLIAILFRNALSGSRSKTVEKKV